MRSAALAWRLAREARPTFAAPHLPSSALRALAARRLAETLREAAAVPLHAERLRAAGISAPSRLRAEEATDALRALPPLGKPELREAGRAALRGGREDPGWWSSRSSGSTGEPFRVWYDARGWALLKHLVKLRARAACGVGPGDRVALLDAIPPAEEGRWALERVGRLRRISVLQPPSQVAAALDAFRPDAIYSLPSALRDALPHLSVRGWRPRAVFTSGELLQDATRADLAGRLRCAVLDVYGSSETKEVAWECPRGGRHVNADVLLVEVLDDEDRPLAPGEEGDLVVTVLVNRAMPLLRYRVGDRGALGAGACPCGRALPLMQVVTGRRADRLQLAGGRSVSPYVLTCALETVEGLARYQVVQLAPDRLRVRARTAEPGLDVEAPIRSAVASALGMAIDVQVELVERFETGPRGKFRVVQPAGEMGMDAQPQESR